MSDVRRYALLIGNDEFGEGSGFGKLDCPLRDVEGMRELLSAPETGLFTDIDPLPNKVNHVVREHLENVFRAARQQDQILIYYSGHGVLDGGNRLYLAMRNSDKQRPLTTSLEITLLQRLIEDTNRRNVALILDCCHSGAAVNDFIRKGEDALPLKQMHDDCGIHILSASTTYEAAHEKDGDDYSLFTKHILTGIRENRADRDQDGYVSIADLHHYVKDQLAQETTHRQRPERNAFEVRGGDFYVARALRMRTVAQLRGLETQLLKRSGELQRKVRFKAEHIIDECEKQLGRQRDYAVPLSLLEKWLAGTLATGIFLDEWEQWAETPVAPVAPPVVAKTKGDFSVKVKGVPLEMIYVRGGTFMMGSPENEKGRSKAEGPQRDVTVPEFWMGKYQVTQAQWLAVMGGDNPSHFKGDQLPVESVSWDDAQAFCQRLTEATQQPFRLPTEAEWEYACRAGTTGAYAGAIDEMAWYGNNSGAKVIDAKALWDENVSAYFERLKKNGNQTHTVGQKHPNKFGLFDMHGNVWEWCEDVWHDSYNGAPTDGSAWLSGGNSEYRVLRGGSWLNYAANVRSAQRYWFDPGGRSYYLGFRLVLSARTP